MEGHATVWRNTLVPLKKVLGTLNVKCEGNTASSTRHVLNDQTEFGSRCVLTEDLAPCMLNKCSKRIYSTHFMQLFHPKEEQGQFRGYCACSYGGQCKQLRLQEAAGEVCCHMSLTRRRLSLPAGRLLLYEGRASWRSASDCRSCGSWKAPPGPEIQRQKVWNEQSSWEKLKWCLATQWELGNSSPATTLN